MNYQTWIYKRAHKLTPCSGFVSALSANHAIKLVNTAFGYYKETKVTTTLIAQGQTDIIWYDENGKIE